MTLVNDYLARAAEMLDPKLPRAPEELERSWELWLRTLFPISFQASTGRDIPFGVFHADLWEWVWALRRGFRPHPLVAIWSRGAGKSTSAELACVRVGAAGTRRYVLYCSATQDQADDHVQNIAGLLESEMVARYYPSLAARKVGKYGNSKGWRRNRIRTESGLTIDAIGLDSAARGAKIDEDRPDLEILDDIDEELDTPRTVEAKIKALTKKLIPAGSDDVAILAVQNLVHEESIFARMAGLTEQRADFLSDRIVSGPHPALEGFAAEPREGGGWTIVGGTPTWEGLSLERCQQMVDDMGLTAFQEECQHNVDAPPGGMFDHIPYAHCRPDEVPDLVRVACTVDPAVSHTDDSDSHGIQIDGIDRLGRIFRLFSWERRATPEEVLQLAIWKALEYGASSVGVETDQGGDTWEVTYRSAWRALVESEAHLPPDDRRLVGVSMPRFVSYKAGATQMSKVERAARMLADYERAGRIVHVLGTHGVLEKALRRFPKRKPYDLVDASFWGWYELREGAVLAPPWVNMRGAAGGWMR